MPLTFLIMFASAHLENLDLFVATLCNDRCLNLSTFDQWGTEANGFTFTDGKNLIESDFGSDVSRYLFYFIFFANDTSMLCRKCRISGVQSATISRICRNAF